MENFANITGKHLQVINFVEKVLLKIFGIDFLHYIISGCFLKSLLSYFLKRPGEEDLLHKSFLKTFLKFSEEII